MHYFGGSTEMISFGGPPIAGFKMRCGTARSKDGLLWEKDMQPLIEPSCEEKEWDSIFASWPRALPAIEGEPQGEWLLTYHALQPPTTPDGPRRWAAGESCTAACTPMCIETRTCRWDKDLW